MRCARRTRAKRREEHVGRATRRGDAPCASRSRREPRRRARRRESRGAVYAAVVDDEDARLVSLRGDGVESRGVVRIGFGVREACVVVRARRRVVAALARAAERDAAAWDGASRRRRRVAEAE